LYFLTKFTPVKHRANIIDIHDIERDNDTIFIMGSGYSINDITNEEWKYIGKNADTMSFNYFFRGEFTSIDYHVMRETSIDGYSIVNSGTKEYTNHLFKNPYYNETTYFVYYDSFARNSTYSLMISKDFENKDIVLCGNSKNLVSELKKSIASKVGKQSSDYIKKPAKDIKSISHNRATLFDTVNLCYLLGYDEIVLAGVDLYDSRYFWLDENEVRDADKDRGQDATDEHKTHDIVIEGMNLWRNELKKEGVKIYVYNPKSLLHTKNILPVYQHPSRDI